MPLIDVVIRNAKSKEKPYKLADEKGMYLLVNNAGKYFRKDYRYAGKRKTLSLGVYPEVRLAEAREKRDEARKQIRSDVDPLEFRKEAKAANQTIQGSSLEFVAREWFFKNKHIWSESHANTISPEGSQAASR
ncbi:tyrosine-type recombinase/integrase [Desulfatibacillum aliphaticivorans]|uniref:tyrosine-type recombinase/integrase n=1 Tax=Desulfatibacillum aliphaticivorans TaxID=218208 RepID=UPI00016014AE|nr:Arm DNA-binding domain-containing protein [Desulfatibacillum aliphaticivorans]